MNIGKCQNCVHEHEVSTHVKKNPEPMYICRMGVGDYIITHVANKGIFWITNGDGEGIQTTTEKFENLIADFYYDES